jgi:hypothetical protein
VNARLVRNTWLYRSHHTSSRFWLVKRKYTVAPTITPWVEWISPGRKYVPSSLSAILLVSRQPMENAVPIVSAIGLAGESASSPARKAAPALAIRASLVPINVIPNPE